MLTELKTGNRLTLPQELVDKLPRTHFFDACVKGGVLTLEPLPETSTLEEVRGKMRQLGLGPRSVSEAIKWARRKAEQ